MPANWKKPARRGPSLLAAPEPDVKDVEQKPALDDALIEDVIVEDRG